MQTRALIRWSAALSAGVIIISSWTTVHAAAAPTGGSSVSAGPVIVDVNETASPQSVAAKYGITPTQVYTEAISGFAATVTEAQLASLRTDRTVESITADVVVARRSPRENRKSPGPPPASTPPQFEQYVAPEIRRIGGLFSKTADIDGIDDARVDADIAIVDGGIDPYHPDLNVVGGYDCVAGPKAERGYYDHGDGHGTLVAGLAAAIDNGIGVVGAAPGARLYAVRVADVFGSITNSALLCGLEWVIRHSDVIDVANLSLAGYGNLNAPCVDPRKLPRDQYGKRAPVDRIHQKICRAVNRGVSVVAAAGNDAADTSDYTPAAYEEVIAVSAFTDYDGQPGGKYTTTPPECFPGEADDTFATFSNFGKPVDVSAPGVCSFTTAPGGLYGNPFDGTSFSAPLVSGAAALLKAKNPALTPATIRTRIVNKAMPGPISGDPDRFPEGILNIAGF